MRRCVTTLLAMAVVGWLGLPAHGWIVSHEVEQIFATDQNNFELEMDGHVRPTGGGKDPATNAFAGPNLQHETDQSAPPAYPYTILRFLGINTATGTKAVIPNSPGVKRQFTLFGDGPQVPRTTELRWRADGTTSGNAPAVTVQFRAIAGGSVQVTLTNDLVDSISVSSVGYRILKINSFRAEDLNRAHMPPAAFTASTVPDGTILAPAGSATFTVPGVGLHDDVVVHVQTAFDPAPVPANPGATWTAWNSGTYIPARKPFFGRIPLVSVAATPGQRAASAFQTLADYVQNAVHTDLMAKTPLKEITPIGGASPGRYFGYFRASVEPGANTLERSKTTAWADLLLSSSGSGGLKKSYLRTAGENVYKDVRVLARVLPGASSNSTLGVARGVVSDDFGGPVAIRISPLGDSYFASVLTRSPTQIDLVKEVGGVKTVIASTGPGALWDNGDPIQIDRTDPVPVPGAVNPFKPKVYDVTLQAVGGNLTLTVQELVSFTPVAGHTKTITAADTELTEGYVGLRTERDGSLDPSFGNEVNGDHSAVYETMIRKFEIEDPNAAYTHRVAVGSSTSTGVDAPNDDGGTLPTQRSDAMVSDLEIAQLAYSVGVKADVYQSTYEMDHYTYRGAYADGPTAPFIECPAFNTVYNLYWQSGTSAGATTHHGIPLLDIPVVIGEHVVGGERRCEAAGGFPHHPLDTCAGDTADARAGMYVTNSGDFRGGTSAPDPGIVNPWGGNLYPHPDQIRLLKASGDPSGTNGDPGHPLVAGLGDSNGFVRVYAYPWRHYPSGGNPAAAGATILAVEANSAIAGSYDGALVNGHKPWGLIATPAGTPRLTTGGANNPNPTFPANNVFFFCGDHNFHRMTAEGREIARRSLYWSLNVPIPPSPFLYYGDSDEDGDVDAFDFGHFTSCLSGSGVQLSYENQCADMDADGDADVDSADLAVFKACFSGAGVEPDASCPTPQISIPGAPPAGTPPTIPFDYDGDLDVDATDLDTFKACRSGPAIAHSGAANCVASDREPDGDVDHDDYGAFQRCWTGAGNLGDPGCAN